MFRIFEMFHVNLKAGFQMIADDRGSQIAESSAIVIADDRRR